MKKIYIISFLSLLFVHQLAAQQINNLVPNGDFEDVDSCFKSIGSIWKVNGWNAAIDNSKSSTDYYNTCQLNHSWPLLNPISGVEGNGSVGIVLKISTLKHREYLQIMLTNELEQDSVYMVSLKIKPIYLANLFEWSTDRIELLLSKNSVKAEVYNFQTPSLIDTASSLFFTEPFNDSSKFHTCKGFYKAVGGEKFLTIGNFSADSLTNFHFLGNVYQTQLKQAYYLIDDVKLYKASDTLVRKLPEPIMPNVFSPNQDGVNEYYKIENLPENSSLEVFNRWGSVVFKQQPYQNNWPGNAPNGQPLAAGVYFAILTYQDSQGKLARQKQTVHLAL